MKKEIKVPEVSEGVTEGTVVDLSVAVGDTVEEDQTLLEFETDKAVIAIPSPQSGKVAEIKVSEGDSVKIGAVIMVLETDESSDSEAEEAEEPEETVEAEETEENGVAKEDDEPKEADQEEVSEETEEEETAEKPEKKAESIDKKSGRTDKQEKQNSSADVDLKTVRTGDRVAPAAPSVRRLARDLGVDIYQVQGTGPGERISEADIRKFVRETMQRITGGGGNAPSSWRIPRAACATTVAGFLPLG